MKGGGGGGVREGERGEDIPCKNVTAQYTAYDVAEMRNIVHIRQSTGDQHIPLSRYGETVGRWL